MAFRPSEVPERSEAGRARVLREQLALLNPNFAFVVSIPVGNPTRFHLDEHDVGRVDTFFNQRSKPLVQCALKMSLSRISSAWPSTAT